MKAWEELSGPVKAYIVIAVVLIGIVFAVRSCAAPDSSTPPPPRGYVDGE